MESALLYRQNVHLDVLAFFREPVHAAEAAGVGPAAVQVDDFAERARARQVSGDRHQVRDGASGFLLRLAPAHLLRALPRIDDSGYALEEPGIPSHHVGTDAELLDEYHPVPIRVHGEDACDVPALEYLPDQLPAHPAAVEAMAQAIAVDAKVPVECDAALDEPDVSMIHWQMLEGGGGPEGTQDTVSGAPITRPDRRDRNLFRLRVAG